MSRFVSRPFRMDDDVSLLFDFARDGLLARRPRRSYYHPGDVAWRLRFIRPRAVVEQIRLWFAGDAVAGFALFAAPSHLEFDVRPGLEAELIPEFVAWAQGLAAGAAVETEVLDFDSVRAETLVAAGFVPGEQPVGVLFERSLITPIPEPALTEGWTVRHPREDEIAERADVHRRAWAVWGPSTFSESMCRRVRSSPVFDPELDIVAVAPDGTFASCLTAWADERTGTGNFEPAGTDPAYARRGIGREAIYEAMRRLRAKGMHTALVGTAAHNTGGLALYPGCGFEHVANEIRYTLPACVTGQASRTAWRTSPRRR